VVAICANIPGCCGCATPVAGAAAGGCAGVAGAVRAGRFDGDGFGGDVLRPLLIQQQTSICFGMSRVNKKCQTKERNQGTSI